MPAGWRRTDIRRGATAPQRAMVIARVLVLLLLVGGLACFGVYLVTGQPRYRALGIALVKWTVIAGLGFFAVLIVQELARRV